MGNSKEQQTDHVNKVMDESVAEKRTKATLEKVKEEFQADDSLRYIKNDTYNAGPEPLLGKVFIEKEGESELKRWALSIPPIIDEKSILREPIKRMELIIENKVAANVEFLTFLSSNVSNEEIYEVKVIDNAAVRLIDYGDDWEKSLIKWMNSPFNQDIINNSRVKSIGIVTGVVQKFIISKKYKKFEASVKGGAYGVNVGGELYTSTSEYTFETRYGVDLVYLPSVKSLAEFKNVIDKKLKIENISDLAAINEKLRISDENSFFDIGYLS
ncbi:hypothetical protein [Marinifilum flexuosum]|uniref:hypothetical protein n=1 Tax=Marinifilum flexuosum TaxID=1117708 RepID=UPI0024944948|nr:hypothetical protein [Marinifilum flexuosum]